MQFTSIHSRIGRSQITLHTHSSSLTRINASATHTVTVQIRAVELHRHLLHVVRLVEGDSRLPGLLQQQIGVDGGNGGVVACVV